MFPRYAVPPALGRRRAGRVGRDLARRSVERAGSPGTSASIIRLDVIAGRRARFLVTVCEAYTRGRPPERCDVAQWQEVDERVDGRTRGRRVLARGISGGHVERRTRAVQVVSGERARSQLLACLRGHDRTHCSAKTKATMSASSS